MTNPYIQDGVERLRTKWPMSHSVPNKYGAHLIIVPGVNLPIGYVIPTGLDKGVPATICTVLFVAPPGFPAACPADFFTDIDLRLTHNEIPHHTQPPEWSNAEYLLKERPQWTKTQWWKWRLQMWNPNQSSLYTYMQVIRQRLGYVK